MGNIEYSVGDFVFFGSYPQNRVTDEGLVSALNELAGALPQDGSNGDWTSYKYYSSLSDNDKDYTWYQDLAYQGKLYRGVYFTQYRLFSTDEIEVTKETSHQAVNNYHPMKVYWFEFSPLKWRVWKVLDDKIWLVVDKIVDSQAFSDVVWTHEYGECTLRTWLNGEFLNTAFREDERETISLERIDNSFEGDGSSQDPSEYTFDYVHLLREDEVLDVALNERQKPASDYAKCQGVKVNEANGSADWWLRTPDYYIDMYALIVSAYLYGRKGDTTSEEVCKNDNGVRPALWMKI